MLEASDELALAQTGNRQFLHPPLRRREKGRGGDRGRMLDARLGVRGGQAGLLKYACAISDDRFRIQEQKSAGVIATVARDPKLP